MHTLMVQTTRSIYRPIHRWAAFKGSFMTSASAFQVPAHVPAHASSQKDPPKVDDGDPRTESSGSTGSPTSRKFLPAAAASGW